MTTHSKQMTEKRKKNNHYQSAILPALPPSDHFRELKIPNDVLISGLNVY